MLMRWVAALLGREKKQIRESDVRFFPGTGGRRTCFRLKMRRTSSFPMWESAPEITREDIEAITSGEVQNKIFDLVAAIAEGNKRQALAYYDDLILLKEPPMRILFLIVRQYRILLPHRQYARSPQTGQGYRPGSGDSRLCHP